MYRLIALASLVYLGMGSASLSADAPQAVQAPPAGGTTAASSTGAAAATTVKGATSSTASKPSTPEDDADKIGAWMIEAGQAAKEYVEGLDKGDYAQSWSKGDKLFQKTISQREWESALGISRKPLGKVKTRTLKDQRPAWDPNGLPKGPYMVIEYSTSFEKAPKSVELVTLRKDADGNWRVLTYQVN